MPSSVINSDDGVISGTSGLKSSGGDDGVLNIQNNGTTAVTVNASGNVGIGTSSPATKLTISNNTALPSAGALTGTGLWQVGADSAANSILLDSFGALSAIIGRRSQGTSASPTASLDGQLFQLGARGYGATGYSSANRAQISFNAAETWTDSAQGTHILFNTTATGGTTTSERMRITSGGALLVGKTVLDVGFAGGEIRANGAGGFTVSGDTVLEVNRLSDDGFLVNFRQASLVEGSISVSGTTVSYNGGHLSRWAQMLTKPDLLKGTVMSNLDEMNVYVKPTLYWTEDDELPVDEEGNPTVAVGDLKQETSVSDNEQLNKVKVSDVEGDANVAGVFVNWTYDEAHQVDEINMAMTGDMIIRIAQGVTVARGDLLMSAGDGTAKPQGDDIVRSKTIAKVTSTHVTCTYDDGSYCVPCVLMAC